MNAEAPACKAAECAQFLHFWCEVTGVQHVTLVSINPTVEGTHGRTFAANDLRVAMDWIARQQQIGRNVYFQPNETRPDCANKPSKADMVAVLCRFADIDPLDGAEALADERDRLARLAARLAADTGMPPTAIIDSGNGIQPIWAVTREVLDVAVIQRAEAETKALESALGAGGTHNVDRLLRLPGTVNYPNAKKQKLGRTVAQSRLIFSAPTMLSVHEAGSLAAHVSAHVNTAGLVRHKPKSEGVRASGDDALAALVAEMEAAGAAKVSGPDDLPAALASRFKAALGARKHLSDRWAGMVDDLTAAGRDDSRSGVDLSMAAMAKAAGFSHSEAGLILCAFPHGKANGEDWQDDAMRLRHVARCVLHSHEPNRNAPPAQSDPDAWPEPVDFLGDADMTGAPELKPEHLPPAMVPFVFDTAARMGVDPAAVALSAVVACASVINDDWRIQPKAFDTTWTEQPRLWGAIVGDPSILKSPVLSACTKPIDKLEIEARKRHDDAMRRYRSELAEWKKTKEGDEPKHPVLDRFMVESLTTEALTEVLRDDFEAKQRAPARKVLVRSDELSELLGNLDRYNAGGRGGGDRGAFLRLFNGGRHTVDRVVRGTFACPNWSACILGGIQPGPIQRIARDAADDGMLQRFAYCVPAAQGAGLDRAPNHDAIRQYEALFPKLASMQPARVGAFQEAPDAVTLHADGHACRAALDALTGALKAMPDTTPRMKAALGKFPGIYARLCLVFHLIECASERMAGQNGRPLQVVSVDTARRAMLYLRDVLLPHLMRAEAVMYLTAQTGHARWLAGFILSRGFYRVTRRDITRAYGDLRAPECARELTSVMAGLEAMAWVRAEDPDNPARPPAAWAVNPQVHKLFAERAEQERQRRKEAQEGTAEIIRRSRGMDGGR